MTGESNAKPRIGVPFRMMKEQAAGDRVAIERYLNAVRLGGAEPVEVPLDLAPGELRQLAESLDGIALSGSPADVAPALFHAVAHPKTAAADPDRERTDFALIEHCFAEQKPILAICYGIQSLNVFLGGTLVQDIPSEVGTSVEHDVEDDSSPETFHMARVEPGSRLAELAHQATEIRVNSSHHQSVQAPGRGLRITARAAEGVVEALEGDSPDHWVTAVQWHPERLVADDALSQTLFRELALAARKAAVRA
jgi:putative glutamine amidotransferase